MQGWKRSLTTLLGAVAAGALIWFVPHFDRWSTGGYWAGMLTFALAGLVLGAAQLRGREGSPTALFLVVFVPVLVAGGWVVLATQPRPSWFRDHVVSWSDDIGIGHVVHNLGEHVSVLAFGIGLVFGLTFELAMIRTRKVAVPAVLAAEAAAAAAPLAESPAEGEATVVQQPEEPTEIAPPEEPTVVAPPEEPTVVGTPDEPTVIRSPEGSDPTPDSGEETVVG